MCSRRQVSCVNHTPPYIPCPWLLLFSGSFIPWTLFVIPVIGYTPHRLQEQAREL